MKSWMLIATIFTSFVSGNGSLRDAGMYFEEKSYIKSIESYQEALKYYPEISTKIYYNMGLCYLRMDSVNAAINLLQRSSQGADEETASMAANQLGIIMVNFLRKKDALRHFRQSLVLDPHNELARFNYEVLRRELGNDNENQEDDDSKKDKESDRKLSQDELLRLLEEIRNNSPKIGVKDLLAPNSLDSIPLPIARRLLEDKRRSKTQFIQQLKKAPIKIKKRERRPDW